MMIAVYMYLQLDYYCSTACCSLSVSAVGDVHNYIVNIGFFVDKDKPEWAERRPAVK